MMTRKHFILLARALGENAPADALNHHQWRRDVAAVMTACRRSNPNFSEDRFLTAVAKSTQRKENVQ